MAYLLLAHGAAIDRPDDATGQTPLMYAVSTGNTALCEMLLDPGAAFETAVGRGLEDRLGMAGISSRHENLHSNINHKPNMNAQMRSAEFDPTCHPSAKTTIPQPQPQHPSRSPLQPATPTS